MKKTPQNPLKTPVHSPVHSPRAVEREPDAEPYSIEARASEIYHGLAEDADWIYVPLATSWWRFRTSPEAMLLWGLHAAAQQHESAWRAALSSGLRVQHAAEVVMMADGWGSDALFERHSDAARYIQLYGDHGTGALALAQAWHARRVLLDTLRGGGS